MKIRGSRMITAVYKSPCLDNTSFQEELIHHSFNVGHSSSIKHILCGDFNIAMSRANNNALDLLSKLDVYDFKILIKMKKMLVNQSKQIHLLI